MGKLIAVIGNTAVGKTTLVRQLAATAPFAVGLEEHAARPFQQAFSHDRRYALANQIDYLLLRAEQEAAIRAMPGIGLVDGGLDEDFYVFTRHFRSLGYLGAAEFDLCERLFRYVRHQSPEPDLFILLQAPQDILAERYARRNRTVEIAQLAELEHLQALVDEWAATISPASLLAVDASAADAFGGRALHALLNAVETRLCLPEGALAPVQ